MIYPAGAFVTVRATERGSYVVIYWRERFASWKARVTFGAKPDPDGRLAPEMAFGPSSGPFFALSKGWLFAKIERAIREEERS